MLARLVAESDVVYENNATGTLEKLGITHDWLRQANPSIIFVQVPAYGSSGPYAYARALGVHLEGVMGHTMLRGYESERRLEPEEVDSFDLGEEWYFAPSAVLSVGYFYKERTNIFGQDFEGALLIADPNSVSGFRRETGERSEGDERRRNVGCGSW